jgi:hypothetical protein
MDANGDHNPLSLIRKDSSDSFSNDNIHYS